jgi:hypothetical protein
MLVGFISVIGPKAMEEAMQVLAFAGKKIVMILC